MSQLPPANLPGLLFSIGRDESGLLVILLSDVAIAALEYDQPLMFRTRGDDNLIRDAFAEFLSDAFQQLDYFRRSKN